MPRRSREFSSARCFDGGDDRIRILMYYAEAMGIGEGYAYAPKATRTAPAFGPLGLFQRLRQRISFSGRRQAAHTSL